MIDKSLIKDMECGDWIDRYEPAISQKKKLKFEQGDYVVPIDATGSDKGFKSSYHPQWVWPALNQIGVVVGRYVSPGAYIKYAIKIPSLKKVFPVHSNFLRKATEQEIKKEISKRELLDRIPELEGVF